MKRYMIRRLLMAIPLLLAISFVCFVFINIIPSNPAEVALRVQQMPVITEEAIAEMEEMLGLNKPFLVRYFDWVLGCLRGDFGISYVNPARTVAGELARCLPATLQLAAASFVIVLVLSIPIGFLCAVYKDQWFDKLMRGLVFVTTAMPAYWVGLLLMWLVSVKLGVLPTNGSGTLRHLILPAFTAHLHRGHGYEHPPDDCWHYRGGECVLLAGTGDPVHQIYLQPGPAGDPDLCAVYRRIVRGIQSGVRYLADCIRPPAEKGGLNFGKTLFTQPRCGHHCGHSPADRADRHTRPRSGPP